MKTILVPSDFSKQAEHAARFAMTIAARTGAQVVLHHAYVLPVYATDLPLVIPSDQELEKSAQEGLRLLSSRLKKEFPGIKLSESVSEGFAESTIPQTAKDVAADLVVMGTRGASGLREALIGTISASVLEKTDCPIIVVPEEADWSHFDKILYATSYEEGDFGNVEGVIEFAKAMDAEVILLHIASGKYEKSYEFDAIERFKESIRTDSGFHRISFKLLEDEDVFEGINDYADSARADMVAMTLRDRPFMNKLFQRSLTKRMAYHTDVPLMVMHSKNS